MAGGLTADSTGGKSSSDNSILFGGHILPKKYKRWLVCEMGVLCVVTVVMWVLLALPIIFYYHPLPIQEGEDGTGELITAVSNGTSEFPFPNCTSTWDLDCREDFFRDDVSGCCFPLCPDWKRAPKAISTLFDVVVILSYWSGFLIAIAIVVISVFRRNTMFAFPNSLVVYFSIVYLVGNFFFIITFFDRAGLYCSSRNLVSNFRQVTPFCTLSGMVLSYHSLSFPLWWFMLIAALFWKIVFPLHARSLEAKHQVKWVHISCGLAGLLIPLIPVIAHVVAFAVKAHADPNIDFVAGGMGFGFASYPPIACFATDNIDVIFYTTALPGDIMLAVGLTLILVIFWMVHRQHVFQKATQLKHPITFGVAEKKLLIVFLHYAISIVFILVEFSDSVSKVNLFQRAIETYFACELSGHNLLNPCDRSDLERTYSPGLRITSTLLHGTLPVSNLIFTISIADARRKWAVLRGKVKSFATAKSNITIDNSDNKIV